MQPLRWLLAILLLSVFPTALFCQSQTEMNIQASNAYIRADKKLNYIYKKILAEYRSDTVFIKNLKASQRLWVAFRDAQVKARYPEREPGYYGTMQPICTLSYLEELTNERIRSLKVWIEGVTDGDGCAGSVKIKVKKIE